MVIRPVSAQLMIPVPLRASSLRLIQLIASLFFAIPASLSAQSAPVCEASPEVQAALDKIPRNQPADQSAYQFIQSERSALQALLRRYPGDFFVLREYVTNMLDTAPDKVKIIAEYKAQHEQHLDDPQIAYLYAFALTGRDTPQSIRILNTALQKTPAFPWPHYLLAILYSVPKFLDKAQVVSHEKAFLNACPAALEGYALLRQVADDKDLIAQAAPRLRRILEPRTDPAALGAYSTLWSLEFKTRTPSEYDAVRKRISVDVARIRALNRQDLFEWWSALRYGYQLANDPKQSQWAKSEREARFPLAWEQLPGEEQWSKDHPLPNDDAPYGQKQTYYRELLKQTQDWIKQRPNSSSVWYSRLTAVENLEEVPASEVGACVNRVFELAQADAGPNPVDFSTSFNLAEALYKRKLDPQRQVEMARNGLEQLNAETKELPYYDLNGKKEIEYLNFDRTNRRTQGLFYEADGYVRLKQADNARAALGQLAQSLEALKSQVNDEDDRRKTYAGQESAYWNAMARLAQLQNHKLDAMAYYQSALLDRFDSGSLPARGGKDPLADDAHELWASLGGTDEGWSQWYGTRAGAFASQNHLSWETAQDLLPPFQLTDLQGKTWQLADLKGKVVFLNFWASW